jgi:tRNA(Arg) A34 adenosine deaminase TadA
MNMSTEHYFMVKAIELAREGMQSNAGGPFGCIVVKDGVIVGKGSNKVTSTNDPTAHAEVVAIRDACHNLNTFQLDGCDIYTTCEPCPMCMGAIYWARPRKVYFAGNRFDAAHAGFDDSMIYEELNKEFDQRKIPVLNLGREEAIKLFQEWIDKPDKINY